MAVTLIGEVVNSADSATGFSTGGISGDDDFVEGSGALGVKASNTTIAMETSSLGAGAPYDFSVGGAEEGYHFIGWFNTKTPIAASGGLRFFIGNSSTNFVHYYVDPTVFYKGGFITKVVDPALTADVAGGTFSVGSNPSQLTAINNMGMVFNTITSIMGSFNNVQVDQFTIGLGVRVDAGTVGTPNTFETVRAQDEDTSFWGWWSSTQGSFIGKGKLYIGPATGTATSVFDDTAFSVIFADEKVSTDFYEINVRGTNTTVSWDLANIKTANPTNNRWYLTVDSTVSAFDDLNGIWSNSGILSLNGNTTLTGTTFIDCTQVVQNSATLDGITVLDANLTAGVAFIESDDPATITDGEFVSSATGHAIEITAAGTYTFTGNQFSGYSTGTDANGGSTGDNNSAIWFNPSGGTGNLVLNVAGGGATPTVRNSSSGTVTINNNTSVTLTGLRDDTEVAVYNDTTGELIDEAEPATDGTTDNRSFTFSAAAGVVVYITVFNLEYTLPPNNRISNFTVPASDTSIPVTQVIDRTYTNP